MKKPTEREIDQIVIAQADDSTAWDDPVHVRRAKSAPLKIPADLVARAAFLARIHRTESAEKWLTRIIQERIELEEAAFFNAKQELAAKTP